MKNETEKNESNVIKIKDYLHKNIESKKLTTAKVTNIWEQLSNRKEKLIKRSLALGIDIFSIGVIKVLLVFSYATFISTMLTGLDFSQRYQLHKGLEFFDYFLTLCVFIGYFTGSFFIFKGKTLGKKLMKLTTVKTSYIENHNQTNFELTFKQAWHRTAGYLACYLTLGSLFALPFFRDDQKSLAEILSHTTVISEEEMYQLFLEKNQAPEVVQIIIEKSTA
jgi:uncharacterized RDD family membrane protein YckC